MLSASWWLSGRLHAASVSVQQRSLETPGAWVPLLLEATISSFVVAAFNAKFLSVTRIQSPESGAALHDVIPRKI